jgi:hypothetical protein
MARMSRENKFGYGLAFLGLGLAYIIEHYFGAFWGLIAAASFTVIGLLLLVAGHTHREDGAETSNLGKWLMGSIIGILCIITVGGFSWKFWHEPPEPMARSVVSIAFADKKIADTTRVTSSLVATLRHKAETHPQPPAQEWHGIPDTGSVQFAGDGKGFHADPTDVTVTLGEMGIFTRPLTTFRAMPIPWSPFVFGDYSPIDLKLDWQTGKLNYRVTIRRTGAEPILIEDDKITIPGPYDFRYDFNYNDHAVELVDQNGQPIFQLTRPTPATFALKGIFPISPGRVIIANDQGYSVEPEVPSGFRIKPIFRHPYLKYPGQYIGP